MTLTELMAQWPREEFEALQANGALAQTITYEEFLAMKHEQMELARQQRLELFGSEEPPTQVEEPPDLSPADEAALKRAWAAVAAEKAAAEEEARSSARVA